MKEPKNQKPKGFMTKKINKKTLKGPNQQLTVVSKKLSTLFDKDKSKDLVLAKESLTHIVDNILNNPQSIEDEYGKDIEHIKRHRSRYLKLLELIGLRNYTDKSACIMVGISPPYYSRVKGKYPLLKELEFIAREIASEKDVEKLERIATNTNSWQGIAWKIERTFPDKYGKVSKQEITVNNTEDKVNNQEDYVKLMAKALGIKEEIALDNIKANLSTPITELRDLKDEDIDTSDIEESSTRAFEEENTDE